MLAQRLLTPAAISPPCAASSYRPLRKGRRVLADPFLECPVRLELRHLDAVDGRPRLAYFADFRWTSFPGAIKRDAFAGRHG